MFEGHPQSRSLLFLSTFCQRFCPILKSLYNFPILYFVFIKKIFLALFRYGGRFGWCQLSVSFLMEHVIVVSNTLADLLPGTGRSISFLLSSISSSAFNCTTCCKMGSFIRCLNFEIRDATIDFVFSTCTCLQCCSYLALSSTSKVQWWLSANEKKCDNLTAYW